MRSLESGTSMLTLKNASPEREDWGGFCMSKADRSSFYGSRGFVEAWVVGLGFSLHSGDLHL